MSVLFELEKKRDHCSENLLSTYYMLSSVIVRIGKMERKRYGLCQKGTHNLVLMLEWSTANLVVSTAEISAGLSLFFISVLV